MNSDALKILKEDFERRKSSNSSYSLRAYAKNLGISPGILCQILNSKKNITPKIMSIIGEKLKLEDNFKNSLIEDQRLVKKKNHIKYKHSDSVKNLDLEIFSIISDWYHYAILEIINLDSFQNDISWIAKKLNLNEEVVSKAIQNLLSAKLLYITPQNEIKATDSFLAVKQYNFSSVAMRKRQKQIMQLNMIKIDSLDISNRDHSSITLTLDKDLLPEIKEKIKEFRRTLANFIVKNTKNCDEVYELQLSLIPLTETSI